MAQVLVQVGELLGQRHFLSRRVLQRHPKQLAQPLDHLLGGCGVLTNQREDRVKCVEEEVRLELALKGLQLRLGESRLELARANGPVLCLPVKVHRVADPDDAQVDDVVPVEILQHRSHEEAIRARDLDAKPRRGHHPPPDSQRRLGPDHQDSAAEVGQHSTAPLVRGEAIALGHAERDRAHHAPGQPERDGGGTGTSRRSTMAPGEEADPETGGRRTRQRSPWTHPPPPRSAEAAATGGTTHACATIRPAPPPGQDEDAAIGPGNPRFITATAARSPGRPAAARPGY